MQNLSFGCAIGKKLHDELNAQARALYMGLTSQDVGIKCDVRKHIY
jgi:hypothetical protein